MIVYIVTTKSTDRDSDGKIRFVRARCHGVYTDLDRAEYFAEKYNGKVDEFAQDQEEDGKVVQYWENPGFIRE